MSCTKLNARLDTSHYGPLHPFKDTEVAAGSLIGIHNAMVRRLFLVNRGCLQKGF
jgi:hypothetical protein